MKLKRFAVLKGYLILSLVLNGCVAGSGESVESSLSISSLQEELDVLPNAFEITNETDTLLFGEEGTVLFIDSNSFETESGAEVSGAIEVQLKEYYQMDAILAQDLSTISDGDLLETGGMIEVSATAGGEELKLKEGKEVIVHFPKNGSDQEMDLFSGRKNSQGKVEWEEEETTEGRIEDYISIWYTKFEGLDDNTFYLEDGRSIFDWINENIEMTDWEQEYVMFRDVYLYYTLTKDGDMINHHYKMDYDPKFSKRMMKIAKTVPKCKPYTVNGKPVDMVDGWFDFRVRVIPPSYGTNENYLESIEGKYPDFEKQSINSLDQAELHYYIFNSAKLGWLNCDRFVDDPAPKVDMSLDLENPENVMVKLVYKEYKSVVPAQVVDKTHLFKQIPSAKKVTLVLIRNKEDKVEMSISNFKTKSGAITNYEFRDYTMKELKKELSKLN